MSRPLRIEFEGAFHHVMARGNARQVIFLDEVDRSVFLDNLGRVVQRFGWRVWAWCPMSNHYHLLVETPEPNLSTGMREVNGIYTHARTRTSMMSRIPYRSHGIFRQGLSAGSYKAGIGLVTGYPMTCVR